MGHRVPPLGVGIGWRPELALPIERYPRPGFVEAIAEDVDPAGPAPGAVAALRERGVAVGPHGSYGLVLLASRAAPLRERLGTGAPPPAPGGDAPARGTPGGRPGRAARATH